MTRSLVLALAVSAPAAQISAQNPAVRLQDVARQTDAIRQRAAVFEEAGRWEQALGEWAKAVRLDPANPAVAVGHARCLHQLGRHEEAHLALDGAEYVTKHLPPAAAELHKKVIAAWVAADPTVVAVDRQLKAKPGDAELLLKRVRRLHVMNAYDQALADLRAVLAADPRNAQALWLRGRYTRFDRGFAAALPDLKAAAQLAPTDYTIVREYVRALGDLKRSDEAAREWDKVSKLQPATAEGWEVLALEHARYSRYPDAIKCVDSAIKLDPTNPVLHYFRGKYVRHMNDKKFLAGADAHLRDALRLVEARGGGDVLLQSQIHYERGMAKHHLAVQLQFQALVAGQGQSEGLLPEAIRHLDRAIEIAPHTFGYYIERGVCRFGAGQFDGAAADFGVFLAANPQSFETVRKRTAWWAELHQIWRGANDDIARRLEAERQFRKDHTFCTRCSNWYKDTERHLYDH